MKKHLILLLLPLMLAACNSSPTSDSSTPSSEPTESTESTGAPTEESSTDTEQNSVKLTFKGMSWTGELTQENKPEQFVAAVKNPILSSVSAYGFVQVNEFTSGMTTLCVGSKKSEGAIRFNFSKNVTKITYTLQAYYNSYPGGMSKDTTADVIIDEQSVSIAEYETDGTPKEVLLDASIPTTTNTSMVETNKFPNRIFINAIEIFYED